MAQVGKAVQHLTLMLLVENNASLDSSRILLGMKKRGFGAGRWNGFGGKIESGETIIESANRELEEEAGISAVDPKLVGHLLFRFVNDDAIKDLSVHVFRASAFQGRPVETDEMLPKWFDTKEIPFECMWADDRFWMPMLLKGATPFKGEFLFKNHNEILQQSLRQVDRLEVDANTVLCK